MKKNARTTYACEVTLVDALRRGETKAYDTLYQQCRPMIQHLLLQNNGNKEDSSDLLQEAMAVLHRNLQHPNFVLTSKVSTYIFSICRQQWLYQLRHHFTTTDIEPYYETLHEEGPQTPLLTDQQLAAALSQLDEKSQQLLVSFYYGNQSLAEIARDLNLSNANVAKVTRHRCVQRLREVAMRYLA